MRYESSSRAMPRHLFIYGTLEPEIAPPGIRPVVGRLSREGQASVRGALYDLGPYPGLVLSDRVGVVRGSVWRLPEDSRTLAELDRFEGYDPADERRSLFLRRKQLVNLADGRPFECWLYLYNRSPGRAPRVASGDYLAYLKSASPERPVDTGGIPFREKALTRVALRAMTIFGTPEEATRRSQRSIRRVEELGGVFDEIFERLTTVRRLPGIEESTRHWSLAEVYEHLIIVNRRVAEVVVSLGSRREAGPSWTILDLKPHGRPAAELRRELGGLPVELAEVEKSVADWRSPTRHPHPWFGPLDVRNWWALNAIHNDVHRRQVERIRRTLGG
jgi:gamma-glutamylcyclotransferase (GGCT)/AIG2-like uncharacterized protein YtfP